MPCGFTPDEVSDVNKWWEAPVDVSGPCHRDTWDNHNRCIWHTREQNKPGDEIQKQIDDESNDAIYFAYLEDACLTDVDFKTMDFRSASFGDVNFEDVDFGFANYSGSVFEDADLSGKDLYNSKFHNCNFERADLSRSELELVEFNESNLRRANLERIKCAQTNFSGTNLEGAILESSLLTEASFEKAKLVDAVLDNAKISEGTFNEIYCYEDEQEWENAARVYRTLMALARENSIPKLARTFYFRHKQCQRRDYRENAGFTSCEGFRNLGAWIRAEGSRFITGYGDRPGRVIFSSGLIIGGWTWGYIRIRGIQRNGIPVDPNTCQAVIDYFYFSVVTFTTLGYGDFQPVGTVSQILAIGEALLGALFMALLVFVFGRRITW